MEKRAAQTIAVGWGESDITPTRTAELYGQYYSRVATSVRDPLGVTALALEQRSGAEGSRQAILVSCDQAMVDRGLVEAVRSRLRREIPDFEASRLVVSATHTHSAPTAIDRLKWWKHDPALLSPEEFREVLLGAVVSAATGAWRSRARASASAAAALASIGHCRRATYLDGSAEMYGATNRSDFRGMEGGDDDVLGVAAFWDDRGELTGLLVNVPCPSQVMEATYVVSADMFGEMRRLLKERLGGRLRVLCQVGAAGDQSPRDLTRPHRGGPTYWDEAGMTELGARLAAAVEAALEMAKASRRDELVFAHETLDLRLPIRAVSPAEYARATAELAALRGREPADETAPESAYTRFVRHTREREAPDRPGPYDDKNDDFVLIRNAEAVVRRFELCRSESLAAIEVHVLRLGEVGMSTSPFELYQEFGMRIRARSPAGLTLHAQLTSDVAGYLPTERAVAAGGYGALVANGLIGPEGGQLLVEHVVSAFARLFAH